MAEQAEAVALQKQEFQAEIEELTAGFQAQAALLQKMTVQADANVPGGKIEANDGQ